MELAIDIIKSILLPKLEKDDNFDSNKTDATFWELFATAFVDFEKDEETLKKAIYSLELNNPEKIISKLSNIYNSYLKELAENHVLGNKSKAIESLLKSKNQVFEEEVRFLSNLENAIIDIERQRIIAELPTAYDSLVAELNKKETKIISLSWIKYAAAAIVIFGILIIQPTTTSNQNIFANYEKNSTSFIELEYDELSRVVNNNDVRGSENLIENFTKIESENIEKGLSFFKSGNFDQSKNILKNIDSKTKNPQVLIFLAIAQLNTAEIDAAVSNLEYLNKIPDYLFSDDVKFHLAMGYIKQNKNNEAKKILKELISKESKYSNQSKKIIKKMRWF